MRCGPSKFERNLDRITEIAIASSLAAIEAALALALTACAGQHFTPGLTLKCDGHCRIVPANLDHSPDPAALRPTRRLP